MSATPWLLLWWRWIGMGQVTCTQQQTVVHITSALYMMTSVIKWKHILCNWPFVRGIHRSLEDSPQVQWQQTWVHITSALYMMTSSNGNIFHVTGPLWGEYTGQSPVDSPRKVQWPELWCFLWPTPEQNGWPNNRDAGDLRCHCAHNDVTVMTNLWQQRFRNLNEP